MKVLKGIFLGLIISLGISSTLSFNAYADPPKHIQEIITNKEETTKYNPNITAIEKKVEEPTNAIIDVVKDIGRVACVFSIAELFAAWIKNHEGQLKAITHFVISVTIAHADFVIYKLFG